MMVRSSVLDRISLNLISFLCDGNACNPVFREWKGGVGVIHSDSGAKSILFGTHSGPLNSADFQTLAASTEKVKTFAFTSASHASQQDS